MAGVTFFDEEAEKRTATIAELDLMSAVPILTHGKLERPEHLRPVVDAFEAIQAGVGQPTIITCPPRFGKTRLACNALAWMLAKDPSKVHLYSCYAGKLAIAASKIIRLTARDAGIRIPRDEYRADGWKTAQGGGLLACGIKGALTGFGCDGVAVCDDAFKSAEVAGNLVQRDGIWEWFESSFLSRLAPKAIPVVIGTRWHVDDLIGRLLQGRCDEFPKWNLIHLRAIETDAATGEERSLWPSQWPLERLRQKRGNLGGSRNWFSLYQGEPMPEAGQIFGPATFGEMPEALKAALGRHSAPTSELPPIRFPSTWDRGKHTVQ